MAQQLTGEQFQQLYDQIHQLVVENRAPLLYPFVSDSLLMCLIWKESSFDPSKKNSGSSATGLMMITKDAVTDVNHNAPHGTPRFHHSEMTDAALNIECGTYYLRILIDRHGSVSMALVHFGTGKAAYASTLLTCEACIKKAVRDTIQPGVPRAERRPAELKPCCFAIHP